MKFKAVCNRLPIKTRIIVVGLPECETICELERKAPIYKKSCEIENGVIKIYPHTGTRTTIVYVRDKSKTE